MTLQVFTLLIAPPLSTADQPSSGPPPDLWTPRYAVSTKAEFTRERGKFGREFYLGVIRFLGSWKSVVQIEWETLKWVDWHNQTRLCGAISYLTPNEAGAAFHASLNAAISRLVIEPETFR